MPAQLKYSPKYHDPWAWSLAIRGATDAEISAAFGISERTLNRWKSEHPSFLEALTNGKDAADSKVERKLYERATGCTTTDTETIAQQDGKGKLTVIRKRTTAREYPPDTMAAMYWLNNRQPDRYRKNPEEAPALDNTPNVHIYLPDNGSDPDIAKKGMLYSEKDGHRITETEYEEYKRLHDK
jgi:hypothetical protein